MASDQSHLDLGCIAGSQLIGDDHIRREALLLQQSTHELCGRSLVSSSLHEQVENFALAVDGKARTACRQSQRPSYRDATARSAVGACAEVLGRTRVRTSKPSASRSRRRHPARARQQILYVAIAQGEAIVERLLYLPHELPVRPSVEIVAMRPYYGLARHDPSLP